MTAGEGAQPQRAARTIGEHDGAALRVQRADGIVQNRMQQVLFVFQVNQVMAGTQQCQELFARARAAVAVEGDAVEGVFPGIGGGGFDEQIIGRVVELLFAGVADEIDDEGDVAAAEDVVHAQRPFAGAQARAVEEGAVGAAEIAHAPAVGGRADFRVTPADRAVVEHDFERSEPAGTEQAV